MNREEKNPNILFDINATELGGNLITELHISIKVKRNNFMASLIFYWLIKIFFVGGMYHRKSVEKSIIRLRMKRPLNYIEKTRA